MKTMFRNFLIISTRNLFKDKLPAFISILGLGVGLASAMVVFVFVLSPKKF